MADKYQGRVIHAVWQASRKGEILHVREAAREIAEATACPHLLDAVADALVQEGIRQRVTLDMNYRSSSPITKPH